jgi:hypothetical protein
LTDRSHIQLLQKDLLSRLPDLYPANILFTVKNDDPGVIWTPEASKTRLLFLIVPGHPGRCVMFDGPDV